MNFFNGGDWFHSFSSHTCNTWKHLFSADWNEGPMSVPIIKFYRFYNTASNEILFKRDYNKQYHRKVLISSFQMNGYTNFHFISGGDDFAWSPLLLNFVFKNFDGFFFAECCAVLWGFFLIAQFLKLLMRPVWGRLRVLLISASGLWMRMKN